MRCSSDREGWKVIYRRIASWLPILSVALLGVLILGWLLLVFARRDAVDLFPSADGITTEYLFDQGGKHSLAEVESLPSSVWQHAADQRYSSCNTGEVLWLKITLRNQSGRSIRGVLENDDFFPDRVDAWLTDIESGNRLHLQSGEGIPVHQKAINGRAVAFPVVVPAEGQQVVLLRVEDWFKAYVRLIWWPDESAFQLAKMRGGLAEGIYLGGLLALLGYNTLLWLRLRQSDVGYYVLYLATAAVFMALARAHLPEFGFTLSSPRLEQMLGVVMTLHAIFLTLFAKVFLELKRGLPRTNQVAGMWVKLLVAIAIAMLLMPGLRWLWLSSLVIGITHISLLGISISALMLGTWQARFFLLSFGCLFAGSLPMVAVWFSDPAFRDIGMRGLMIGSGLEMLMLSLAVADRFARTQKQLIEETEQRRMIEETYADELAEEVRERTRELRAANSDKDRMLAVIGHDLRSPLTGLMRSADEVPGSFARDVARTGRTLLLMIEDLVLWARLKAGTRATSVHYASALMAPSVALHHTLAEQGGVELLVQVPTDLRVETDLVLAQTLVRNLLANALKFAHTKVMLHAEAITQDSVRITVSNDGPALSPAVAARLALSEDEPITATGGLGLRLCREICRSLKITLETGRSADGHTQFTFAIKQAPASAATTVEQSRHS